MEPARQANLLGLLIESQLKGGGAFRQGGFSKRWYKTTHQNGSGICTNNPLIVEGGHNVLIDGRTPSFGRPWVFRSAHLAISPVLLRSGECLFQGIDVPKLGYQLTEHVSTPNATHVVITKRIDK